MNETHLKHRSAFCLFLVLSFLSITAGGQKPSLIVETGHDENVLGITFSKDGRLMASTTNSLIKIWDVATGKELRSIRDLYTPIPEPATVAFSPNGSLIARATDNSVLLWDVNTGEVRQSLTEDIGVGFNNAVCFSPDGVYLATSGLDQPIRTWDLSKGTLRSTFKSGGSSSLAFSNNGKLIVSGDVDGRVRLWDFATSKLVRANVGHKFTVNSVSFSPDNAKLASGSGDGKIGVWDIRTGRLVRMMGGTTGYLTQGGGSSNQVSSVTFSPDGSQIASGNDDGIVNLWSVSAGSKVSQLKGHQSSVRSVSYSPNGSTLVSGGNDKTIRFWDPKAGKATGLLSANVSSNFNIILSPAANALAHDTWDNEVKIWNLLGNEPLKVLRDLDKDGTRKDFYVHAVSPDGAYVLTRTREPTGGGSLSSLLSSGAHSFHVWEISTGRKLFSTTGYLPKQASFSPNSRFAAIGLKDEIEVWDLPSRKLKYILRHDHLQYFRFSKDSNFLVSDGIDSTTKLWDLRDGSGMTFPVDAAPEVVDNTVRNLGSLLVSEADNNVSADGKWRIQGDGQGGMNLTEVSSDEVKAHLFAIEGDWVAITPDGRFDTNRSLDTIEGLHWVLPDLPLRPTSINVFLRQYYEPELLPRLLKCNQVNNCGKEFKSLPSIAELNRVQTKVAIRPPKPVAGSDSSVDVTVEVESVSEQTKAGSKSSGVYDLRLFRDGQLVGTSTPKDRTEKYIADAPKNVAAARPTDRVMDSPEDRAWRVANDLFTVKSDNVRIISPTKSEVTFRSVKLPRDGRKEVEFTAYAFNSDRVKSDTARTTYKIEKPQTRLGRAYLISIGVNASENSSFDLKYAANDARKMQKEVGSRLNVDGKQYSEVVQIPLISDRKTDEYPAVNDARKEVIKGVFSLLAGAKNVPDNILKQIPNADKIKPVEPEDTLIITYAGHGYADRSGIFYLVPNDIGADAFHLTSDMIGKLISSDELSLWMQDITAAEMIMVIDACHSSTAVQGEGFKPGPMGSRGLGQLAYDKGMRILSATQANNVALEMRSLRQGLLSYALLEDGIVNKKADTGSPADGKLTAGEWLNYAVSAVPKLYQDVLDGKRSIIVGDRLLDTSKLTLQARADPFCEKDCDSKKVVQQPTVFDFRRKKTERDLITLR